MTRTLRLSQNTETSTFSTYFLSEISSAVEIQNASNPLIVVCFWITAMRSDFLLILTTPFRKFGVGRDLYFALDPRSKIWESILQKFCSCSDWHEQYNGHVCLKSLIFQLYVLLQLEDLIILWIFQISCYLKEKFFLFCRKQPNCWLWHMKDRHHEEYWLCNLKFFYHLPL